MVSAPEQCAGACLVIRSQNLIPLNSGAYQARDKIADYQICENLFPETNPPETDAPVAVTHYPREGLRPLSAPPSLGLGRGVFALSNGALLAVVSSTVYSIGRNWQWTQVGVIDSTSTPVSVKDNGQTAVLVDGTLGGGYEYTMASGAFAQIVDPTGTFVGSNYVDFSDTFFAFATIGSNQWIVSNPNSVTFNALQVAAKDSKPDPIISFAFNLRVMWLIGAQTTEVWWLSGNVPFPYQEFPNVLIPYGSGAPYSLIQADVDLFWLSRNEQGQGLAVKTTGYSVEAISTRALEYEWSTYPTIADAIGGTYQIAGHTFLIWHFPSANKSWGYDLATKQWLRRTYTDNNGTPNREKVSFYASVGPQDGYPATIVGQDWQTGQIYALDPQTFTDNGQPIVCRRSFPHQMSDMKEITTVSLVIDFSTGEAAVYDANASGGSDFNSDFNLDFGGPLTVTLPGPALCMRYSKDGGFSWSSYRVKGKLSAGEYRSMMRFRGLGMARDWLFEVMFVYPGKCALQGAYIEPLGHSA